MCEDSAAEERACGENLGVSFSWRRGGKCFWSTVSKEEMVEGEVAKVGVGL